MRTALAIVLLVSSCKAPDDRAATQPADPLAATADRTHGGSAVAVVNQDAPLPVGNVVQREMRLMTGILEGTVRGIGMGDVRAVDALLHDLHGAKEATEAAVRSGAYTLPKQPENVEAFLAMDEAFHEHLGALVVASRANDVPAAAEALGKIMVGCHGCHSMFRP